ncbi:serine/arginine repetitive matrix protein 1-like [Centroberyx affinis]|uniref:serine/arginine repetitive matrix protein 1-like n=1 Tax=Centroberyx affinis TaxID=166261 RepID=UPI003A5C6599
MIGRADIEGSKSDVAMNAWPPQASYPCGVPPQSNSPPATVPGAGHARQSRALDTRSESPLGARLPASPAARRQPRRPTGTPRERGPAGAVAGEIREKGPARVQSRRRRPPYPIPSTGPPSDTAADTAPRKPPPHDARGAADESPARRAAHRASSGGERRATGRLLPQPRLEPSPASHPSPTDPALRANPYPEGQRELTGRRRNRDAFQGTGPSLGANPFQGALPFTKKRELSPGLPPASPGSLALPHWTPRGAYLRHSRFGDLNPTPFRSAGGDGGHRPTLPNGICTRGGSTRAHALGFRAHRGGPPTRRGVALAAPIAGDGRVGRPICTSGPLRASTRVSSGFALPRHSSPSFGSYRTRSRSTSPTVRARRAGGAPDPAGPGSHLSRRAPALTFIAPRADPRPGDATRLERTEDSPPRLTVTPGAGGPVPPRRERRRSEHSVHGPGKRRGPGKGRCKAHGRSREPPSPQAFPSRPRAGRGAPPQRKCARRGPASTGERSREGILPHRATVPNLPS